MTFSINLAIAFFMRRRVNSKNILFGLCAAVLMSGSARAMEGEKKTETENVLSERKKRELWLELSKVDCNIDKSDGQQLDQLVAGVVQAMKNVGINVPEGDEEDFASGLREAVKSDTWPSIPLEPMLSAMHLDDTVEGYAS